MEEIVPKETFELIKQIRKKVEVDTISKERNVLMSLFSSYNKTGQNNARNKIVFLLNKNEQEAKMLNLGIDTFVYYDDIEDYILNTENKVIKIIDIKNYERIIPDEIVDKIELLRKEKIFDDFVIVFTDYTGKEERKIEEKRKEKDPIVFGIFLENNKNVSNKMYYIGDWIDEYCDLTLEKLVSEMPDIKNKISSSLLEDANEINRLIEELKKGKKEKKSFFEKIRSCIKIMKE